MSRENQGRLTKWRFTLLFYLPAVCAFANYPSQISVLLDPGANTVIITGTGSVGSTESLTFSPGASERVRFTLSPMYIPPSDDTTYSTCADPCGVSMNRQWGQQYYWVEYVNAAGNQFSPRKKSESAGAYNTAACGGLGTLPMVEPAITTTSPLPMPREVIGQDCYVDGTQLPLRSGHASTSVQYWVEIHSPGYKTLAKYDHKVSLNVNNGSWIDFTNLPPRRNLWVNLTVQRGD
jgi:hypothetical protein